MRVLDVGLGTGLLAREAARIVRDPARVVGIDPSIGMLKTAHVPQGGHLIIGCVEQLPLATGTFDFVSMRYVLRYLPGMAGVFAEIHRVLKPGGRTCILEISRPRNALVRAAWAAHIRGVLPVLARLLARDREAPRLVRCLRDTINGSPKPGAVVRALYDCGFAGVEPQLDLGIFSA
jgi:demethylmenaquinone methyltransferase/2-methoxy-6-polyprenyl-1,4-benzoquinol methylase